MMTNSNFSEQIGLEQYDHRKVLDHGFVALIDRMGDDRSVAAGARVKPYEPWREGSLTTEGQNDEKLIHHLVKNLHTTPLEKVEFVFWVRAPIFVYRQWHRHRVWSYNEESARYKQMDRLFYTPELHLIGQQSKKNHQARIIDESMNPAHDPDLVMREFQVERYVQVCKQAFDLYEGLLESGWPRELARACLPVSTYSQMIAKVNLWNLMKFWNLRSDEHAQYEIRVYSDAMKDLVRSIVPICIRAYEDTRK